MYQLFLIDDHKVVRDGLKTMILGVPQYKIAGEAESGAEALEKLSTQPVDVVFVDLKLPDANGASLIADIKNMNPGLKCILLTAEPNVSDLRRAQKAGAEGFLTKDIRQEEYLHALKEVVQGRKYISSTFSSLLINNPKELSERELQVLQHFADGLTYKEIAAALDISPRTVEAHKLNLLKKLNANTVIGMLREAIRQGLIRA